MHGIVHGIDARNSHGGDDVSLAFRREREMPARASCRRDRVEIPPRKSICRRRSPCTILNVEGRNGQPFPGAGPIILDSGMAALRAAIGQVRSDLYAYVVDTVESEGGRH